MIAKTASEAAGVRDTAGYAASGSGIYIDSSALAKLYVPEAESDRLNAFLRGRSDLLISELVITEVLSTIARKRREGKCSAVLASEIRDLLLAHVDSGYYGRLHLDPVVHREAERLLLLESIALRTLDALHVALALSAPATHIITYDNRLRAAAQHAGLKAIDV